MSGNAPSFLGAALAVPPGEVGDKPISQADVEKLFMSKASPKVAEGSDAAMGTAKLVAGTVTVANTKVKANSRIFLMSQTDGGTPGWLRVSARVADTSFTILSSSNIDTSVVAFLILEPNA
ncbi:MAG: hypothetical protein LV471_09290 [Nitrosomonas sp.]|nr:hypothetical protein [Nitrosomonas sp.]